jgi:hypothetical protein
MIRTLTEMEELETLKQITRAHIVHNEALWRRWGWFAFFLFIARAGQWKTGHELKKQVIVAGSFTRKSAGICLHEVWSCLLRLPMRS